MKQEGKKFNLSKFLMNYAIYIVAVILVVIMSCLSKNFLTLTNVMNIIRQNSFVGMMAIGMTFVIITGGIDLSVAGNLALSGMCAAMFCTKEAQFAVLPTPIAFLVGVLVSGIAGAVIGFVITKGEVAPFVVTLGMQTILRGLALLLNDGRPIIGLTQEFCNLGQGYIGGIAIPIWAFLIVLLIGYVLLHHTRFGRYIFAVGGNEASAKASGINVDTVKMFAYIIAGMTAGISGILLDARVGSASPISGDGYELNAVAAAVIGGTSLAGGVGHMAGTVVGVFIMAIITNGLDLLNVSAYLQQIVKGLIIILAALLDSKARKNS